MEAEGRLPDAVIACVGGGRQMPWVHFIILLNDKDVALNRM